MKKIVSFAFTALFAAALVSCGGESKPESNNPSTPKPATEKPVTTSKPAATPNKAVTPAKVEASGNAAFTFENKEWDFGVINQGEVVEHVFSFTNTGTEEMIISNAKGSCGCTVPVWPREPIPVGGSGEIRVKYNSRGKKNKQNKRVTLTANTTPNQTILRVKGEVKVPEGAATNTTKPATTTRTTTTRSASRVSDSKQKALRGDRSSASSSTQRKQ